MNIAVTTFKGTAPKVDPRLLAADYSQVSTNIKYDSGALIPVSKFLAVVDVDEGDDVKTFMKYRLTTSTDKWLYFTDDVQVARDPANSVTDNRIIVSGLDCPRVFDSITATADTIIDDTNTYKLGLPVPDAPTIAVNTVGVGAFDSRAYTIQYDRVWSDGKIDQGALSYPAETSGGDYYVDTTTDGSVLITGIADAPDGYGITHITINRSGSSINDSLYHYVTTFAIADAKAGIVTGVTWNSGTSTFSVIDDIETIDLGYACINTDYAAPDDTMSGIVRVSDGMLAGFVNNTVCFSEPYQFHAWPEQYKVTVEKPIVGLGYFGDIVVVCTEAEPYIIQMRDPATLVAFPLRDFVPCLSAASIVSYRDSVIYPSDVGLIKIDRTGVYNLTNSLASIKNIKDFNFSNSKADGLGPYYYLAYKDSANQDKMLVFNIQEPETGFGLCDSSIINLYSDYTASILYVLYRDISGQYKIGQYDQGDAYLLYQWKSKVFTLPVGENNFSAARINFDTSTIVNVSSAYDPANLLPYGFGEIGYGTTMYNGYANYTSADYLIFDLYCDGELIYTKSVTNSRPFRLPAGIVGREYEIKLTGNVPVYGVELATSMQEFY